MSNFHPNTQSNFQNLLDEGKFIEFCEKMMNQKGIPITNKMKNPEMIDLEKKEELNFEELKLAAQWAAVLVKNGFKMSGLRKIYEMISSSKDLLRIRFVLAYEVGRKKEFREFGKFLEDILNKIQNDFSKVEKIKIFLEAVIAYHKLINPKEN